MSKFLLSFSVVLFSQFLTAQTIYIQETDMYGNPYIVSYPINVQEPSFIRTYDKTGYEMYYNEQYDVKNLKTSKTNNNTNSIYYNPSSFEFKPTKEFWVNPFKEEKIDTKNW